MYHKSFLNHKFFAHFYCLFISGGASGKEPICQCTRFIVHCANKRHRFDPWVGKIPWGRKWHPTPVFLRGESYGQKSLVGYSPWSCKELDMTEQLSMHTNTEIPNTFSLKKKENSSDRLNEKTAKIKWPKLWSSRNSHLKNFGWYPNLYDPE